MPKPFSHYKIKDGKSDFDPELAAWSPLIPYVYIVIGHSANCDMLWTCMAARFLKSDFEAAHEMLVALKADSARTQAIRAAANAALPADDFALYEAVRKKSADLSIQRHKFAHWSVGLSPDIPDALLLFDNKLVGRQLFFAPDSHVHGDRPNKMKLTIGDAERNIEVYEAKELKKIALDSAITEFMVMSLFQAIGPKGDRRDAARTWLFEGRQSPLMGWTPPSRSKK
jgi:hypothetical protein